MLSCQKSSNLSFKALTVELESSNLEHIFIIKFLAKGPTFTNFGTAGQLPAAVKLSKSSNLTFKALTVELESPNLEHCFIIEFLAIGPTFNKILTAEQLLSCQKSSNLTMKAPTVKLESPNLEYSFIIEFLAINSNLVTKLNLRPPTKILDQPQLQLNLQLQPSLTQLSSCLFIYLLI